MFCKFLLLAAAVGLVGVVNAGRLAVPFDASTAAYTVTLDGEPWLQGDRYAVRNDYALLLSGSNLTLDGPFTGGLSGNSAFGPWNGWAGSFSGGLLEVQTQVYASIPGHPGASAVVFRQSFPKGLKGTALPTGGDNEISTGFPTFTVDSGAVGGGDKAYLAWAGCMSYGHLANFTASGVNQGHVGLNGGPLVLFNSSGAAVAMSSLSNVMTSSLFFPNLLNHPDGTHVLAAGLSAQVASVPAGWTHEVILVSGGAGDINSTVHAWGDLLLLAGGKKRTALDADLQTSLLSYWTDNGAFYYYNNASDPSQPGGYMNNQASITAAVDYYTQKEGIPMRAAQLDSFWYFKEGAGPAPWGGKGAVTLWEPIPAVIPSGFSENWLGLPLALHNRYFAAPPNNSYIDMGFDFLVEAGNPITLPLDERMFRYIMAKAQKAWGMTLYEQDWLITVYQGMNATQSNLTAALTWLGAMNAAAMSLNLTIQYCMPLPLHMLASTQLQAVTNARASGDYHPGSDQWSIGLSSIFYHAIGIQPSKDDWWSTQYQPGNPYSDDPSEPNSFLQGLVTTLSTGPVGPSDGIGFANASLILRSCRADGLLLRPDVPAVTMDRALLSAAFPGAGHQPASNGYAPLVATADRAAAVIAELPSEQWPRVYAGDITVPDVVHSYTSFYPSSDAGTQSLLRWHYIAGVRLGAPFTFELSDLGDDVSTGAAAGVTQWAVFDFFQPQQGPVATMTSSGSSSSSSSFTVPTGQGLPGACSDAHNLRYYVVAPLLPLGSTASGTLFGEVDKFAPMSRYRWSNLSVSSAAGGTISADVNTSKNAINGSAEPVSFWVFFPGTGGGSAAGGMVKGSCVPNTPGQVMRAVCSASAGGAAGGGATCTCA